MESLDTTNKSREALRYTLYIIVGLLTGLAVGIGVGPRIRDFVMSNGWPDESISWITLSLVFVSMMLNGFLYQGWKKNDHMKSGKNSSPKSESS